LIAPEQIEYGSQTDTGLRRAYNQDAHAVLLCTEPEQWKERGHIFVVCDGMGAHAVGELASELAAGVIPHTFHKHAGDGPEAALRKAFAEANITIHRRGQQNREFQGMGTTSTALLLQDESAWVAHVGDSRAYRVRDGLIEQLSFDHSLLWEMARRQKVHPRELQGIPTNVIIRSLGPDADVDVDIEGPHPLQVGDIFIVCCDGLSGLVTDQEIGAVASVLPPAEACSFLVQLANLRGGPDNITVIIVRVTGNPAMPRPKPEGPAPEVEFRTPWYRRLPWPVLALSFGVLLAAEAALLAFLGWDTSETAFALAAVVLLVGLIGLGIHYVHTMRQAAAAKQPRRLKVYEQTSCRIDRALLDRLAGAEATLEQLLREKQWEVDWPLHEKHHEHALAVMRDGDLGQAFAEYCRAIRPFTDAVQRRRDKEDVFRPLWEGGRVNTEVESPTTTPSQA
jgi:serine/threonine protein phosphatase PrpC